MFHQTTNKDNPKMPYIMTKVLEIPSINDDVRNVMIRDMSVSPSAD